MDATAAVEITIFLWKKYFDLNGMQRSVVLLISINVTST